MSVSRVTPASSMSTRIGIKRQLELAVELVEDVVLGQLRQQEVGQSEGDVSVGGGVLASFLGRDIDHRELVTALADQVLDRRHLDAEFAQSPGT